jgi:hypothetical protein
MSINRPRAVKPRFGVVVEPFEFISNGGGVRILPRLVKRRGLIFYEVVNIKLKSMPRIQVI